MTLSESAFPLRNFETAPVKEWIDDLRGRVDSWASSMKQVSSEEWAHLQRSVSGALSADRVQGVLRSFLARTGLRQRAAAEIAADSVNELRVRILEYRNGETIDSYAEHLSPPPTIEF